MLKYSEILDITLEEDEEEASIVDPFWLDVLNGYMTAHYYDKDGMLHVGQSRVCYKK